jgi:D-glycero-alpha-D-manno-heptose-7-phosphate kinase
LGLAGGGTDVSPYCDTFGGAVMNATLDRYAWASFSPRRDGRIVLEASDLGDAESLAAEAVLPTDRGLRLHRGVYNRMIRDFNGGEPLEMTLTTYVESPLGSGLGSSSALVVAMVELLARVLKAPLGEYEVAKLATEIERADLGLAGGRQDQYAATFGGFNFLEFQANDRVIVNPLRIRHATICELEASLLLVSTGASRQSAEVISSQAQSVSAGGRSLDAMHELKAEAYAMKEALLLGDVGEIAAVLRRGWEAKKSTSAAVSTPLIEELFDTALGAGALAGKVSGAGGGGFIMFLVDPDRRAAVTRAVSAQGFITTSARFTNDGCAIWESPSVAAAAPRDCDCR